MLDNSTCNILCSVDIPNPIMGNAQGGGDGRFINELIEQGYSMNWLIDGLPAATIRSDAQTGDQFYNVGFELGSVDDSGLPILYNHYDIVVEFHVLTPPLSLD